MSVFFLVRPLKIIAKRIITDADKVIAAAGAGGVFVPGTSPVAGSRMQFNLGAASIAQIIVSGVGGGANPSSYDLLLDGVLLGTGQALVSGALVPASPAGPANGLKRLPVDANFSTGLGIEWITDQLGTGVHTLELWGKGDGGAAQLNAAVTSNPLIITVIEHAEVYPPPAQ